MALDEVRTTLSDVIPRLRRHMEEEESELFPTIENILQHRDVIYIPEETLSFLISEDMTVNQLITYHPSTWKVFKGLLINVGLEGASSLREVAARYGMKCQDLIDRLELTITNDTLHTTCQV